MVHACNLCGALHWLAECLTSSSQVNPKFGRCCLHGKVVLPHLTRPPQTLELLLGSCQDFLNNPIQLSQVQCERSKHFHQYIRSYNAAFAFVSLGYKPDEHVSGQGGPPVFKIRGTLSHCHGTLLLSWYNLLSFLSHLCLSPAPSPSPSDSICPHPPASRCLRSNSEVYLCNYATSALRLASD